MPVIKQTQPWTQRPTQATGVNLAHPLAAFLQGVIRNSEGAGPPVCEGAFGQNRAVATGSPTWAGDGSSVLGAPTVFYPGSAWHAYTTTFGNVGTSFTIVIWLNVTGTSATQVAVAKGITGAAGAWILSVNSTLTTTLTIVSTGWSSIGAVYALGAWFCLEVTGVNGSAPIMYINGIQTGLTSLSVIPSTLSNTANMRVGASLSGALSYTGSIGQVEFWTISMSQSQLIERFTNPFSIFQSLPGPGRRAGFTGARSVQSTGTVTLGPFIPVSSATFNAPSSGAVTLAPFVVAASPGFTAPASGTVTFAPFTQAGSASFGATGAGAPTLAPFTTVGAATFAAPASGSITLAPFSMVGTGAFTSPASGSVTLAPFTPAAIGNFTATASGAVTFAPFTETSTASAFVPGTGVVTLGPLVVAGVGGFIPLVTASGGVTLGSIASAGAGFVVAPNFPAPGAIITAVITTDTFSSPHRSVPQ